jgi:mycofactocin system glycosyltransferase
MNLPPPSPGPVGRLASSPSVGPPPSSALPQGFRVKLDHRTREIAAGVWSGGSPARVIRLTPAGRAVWRRLAAGPVDSRAAGALARKLTDAGLAHPVPPPVAPGSVEVTVVVPVRDRAELLDRCLAALDGPYPVIVVDDASRAPDAIAAVAAAHGAKLVRRDVNGGPAAARNTGLDLVRTELVAFVDSDCVPSQGWIDRLAGHFTDPSVAAVAPRITALAGSTTVGRYTHAAGTLDLGTRPARVAPNTRLSYVPSAALIARRSSLLTVVRPGGVFDPDLSVGEDVDLLWRLHAGGWRIRYDPAVVVHHHEPTTWPALLARRRRYGTSAAPLALRHPGNLAPLVLDGWAAVTVAAGLSRRPIVAGAACALSVLAANRTLRSHGLPTDGVVAARATAAAKTWLGIGRYATQYAMPLLLAAMLPGGRRRWGRRAAAASLLLGPPVVAWATRRPAVDPVRFAAAALADDVAYGAGVWAGCWRHRTVTPLRPVISLGKRGRA